MPATATLEEGTTWIAACEAMRLQTERGAAVLLPGGYQAAVFRTHDGALYAVDNVDPRSGAAVLSRGIVGDRDGEPTIASPVYKDTYSLRTGLCLDASALRIATLPVREEGGRILVGAPDPGT